MTSPLTFPGTGPLNRRTIDEGRGGVGSDGRDGKRIRGDRGATRPDRRSDHTRRCTAARARSREAAIRTLIWSPPRRQASPLSVPPDFPAFAGTMAVERVATGFRWAEGPSTFPAGRYGAVQRHSQQPHHALLRR